MSPTLDLDTLVLKIGAHEDTSREMCVMEAVAYVAGEPWSDRPSCSSPVISAFLRSYNDSVSDEVRQTLKPFIPRLVGTAASPEIEERRSLVAADWLVRVHTPAWLRLAGLTSHADALESLPEITSMAQVPSIKGPIEAARTDAAAARVAARDAAWDAARVAVWDAAGDAAWVAAGEAAGVAARDAARAAAWVAAGVAALVAAWVAAEDAAGAAAWDAARDAARAAAWVAAWVAARAATWDALKPTVLALQATIPALIERMITATVD